MLGADTRATSDTTVFEKNCEKIHYIADNIMCCGAGTAADTEHTTQLIASQLALHRLATRRESRVATALNMLKQMLFRYQGHVSAALVLGGVDFHGPHLYTVYPHGKCCCSRKCFFSYAPAVQLGAAIPATVFQALTQVLCSDFVYVYGANSTFSRTGSTDRLPYVTMGSGSLAAMAVFEAKYKEGMAVEDAKQLVYEGISAGIFNDLGSGGNVDLCIITKGQKEYIRGYAKENERKYRRPAGYDFVPGTTEVVPGSVTFKKPLADIAVVTDVATAKEGMDVSS